MEHLNSSFWKDKRVFLTGHTGFKGSWLSIWLHQLGAKVYGFSLPPATTPSLFTEAKVEKLLARNFLADVRNERALDEALQLAQPEIVFHLAAQPLVRLSYQEPVETYATNIMGTVHLMDSIRRCSSVRSVVIVTTDKVYENREWDKGYQENETLGGYDPYSSSKACAELVVAAMRRSFFNSSNSTHPKVFIASARAGNVIGGGDWAVDRLIPDMVHCFYNKKTLKIRSPQSTRPWQHVLDPLSGYLLLAHRLYEGKIKVAEAWNFGPAEADCRPVSEVIDKMSRQSGIDSKWEIEGTPQPHEAKALKLDCTKAQNELGWTPRFNLEQALNMTASWYRDFYLNNGDAFKMTQIQIDEYSQEDRDER